MTHEASLIGSDIKFSGSCNIDYTTKVTQYTTVSGSTYSTGSYKFEFEFTDNSKTFVKTYPDNREITFEIVEDFE